MPLGYCELANQRLSVMEKRKIENIIKLKIN
ncbi:hypothetical protein L323_14965 [Ruminiclostridium papyrosolvens C7]|uniref:Uncharacterized protein n=1 Tax=Ruminiclostridium papyrosolvens C7 TaxID=1330534 RepID=U4QYR2_9FIRM|nr:hypothetical protein L323_14965 [Ruminiclostridium papyrosolvens C7]